MRHKRLLATLTALAALAAPAAAPADTVTDWNAIASTAIATNAGQPPHLAGLSFAMVQGAVYDAVNAVAGGYQPYLAKPQANPWDSQDAAAAIAVFRVLASLFPAQAGQLQATYDAYVAGLPDVPAGARAGGIAAGEAAAAALIAARTGDGRGGPFTFVFGTGPDKMEFSAFSNKSGTTRSFDRFSRALKEVIDARVWAGIHFRTADEQGAVIGKKVAHWEDKHYFQRLG